MNIDRKNREKLVNAIERYLADKTKSDTFDDEIDEISYASNDPTVAHVVDLLWCHYSDLRNHKAALSKEEWDYFYRLMLLLKSDAHIEVEKRKLWCFTQVCATVAFAVFAIFIVWFGIGMYLFAIYIPCIVLSVLLSYLLGRSVLQLTPMQQVLTPFSSISEILKVRRSVRGFKKRRYPPHMKFRLILHALIDLLYLIPFYVLGLVFGPLFLVPQLFPETIIHSRVRMSP
jgi:hypothetical protein